MKCNSNKSFVRLCLTCPLDNKTHRFMLSFHLTAVLLHAPCTGKFSMLLMFRRCTCQDFLHLDFFFFSLSTDSLFCVFLDLIPHAVQSLQMHGKCNCRNFLHQAHSPNLFLHNISTGDEKNNKSNNLLYHLAPH